MKIRFLKRITVDVEHRNGEIYDRTFNHWQELWVESIYECSTNYATIKTETGEFLHAVPMDSFERLVSEKKLVLL